MPEMCSKEVHIKYKYKYKKYKSKVKVKRFQQLDAFLELHIRPFIMPAIRPIYFLVFNIAVHTVTLKLHIGQVLRKTVWTPAR